MTAIALTSSGKPANISDSTVVSSANPSYDHASIDMYEATDAPGGSKRGSPIGSIAFQFNPKEVTISKSAKWERKPVKGAKQAGPPEFSGADPCKLTLEMFFDATLKHTDSVVDAVEKLFSCCVPVEKSRNAKKPMPPLVVFKWGNVTSFPAFVTQVSAKYTRFAPNGVPIRAVCSVNLEEMPAEQSKQNPTSGVFNVDRAHTMISGDTLALVAYREYGNPNMWRALADYNRIDDPMRIAAGTPILLPPAETLAR
ncbi:CIS tube protein [Mycolicibacterium monacense]|uniref:Peptidase M23 n=2 Tax=Mycobacteriaceae TaxID=1762 RepID=A0AAD1N121_MYCMB|nr:peptidase M23 [Mycolicibacterium monacense]MDA4100485.1 peptidase M23B [Mycolicibacterium monacense DSM 44395]OBB62093.1 peptidase M23 [Mycolicibacterium monacense]OBF54912.1 peptidase M23 [Mycolicibacterium monacense]ORB21426.1 peptidase M23 [Mycolicibacterium monacense DSM 44395]BBZ62451.1 peptidase M23 [Mycolicibacterium monacense]